MKIPPLLNKTSVCYLKDCTQFARHGQAVGHRFFPRPGTIQSTDDNNQRLEKTERNQTKPRLIASLPISQLIIIPCRNFTSVTKLRRARAELKPNYEPRAHREPSNLQQTKAFQHDELHNVFIYSCEFVAAEKNPGWYIGALQSKSYLRKQL